MRALLTGLLLFSLAGCWSWSFPEERFQVDGGTDGPALLDGRGDDVDAQGHECEKHPDCVPRSGKPLCDPKTKTCVACLSTSDCVKSPATAVCDTTTLECVACLGSSDCTHDLASPICDTSKRSCVGCLASADCLDPLKPVCDTGKQTCVGCLASTDCTYNPAKPICDTGALTCVGCLAKADCPGKLVCDTTTKTCVGCSLDADCPTNSVCDKAVQTCVGCLADPDCSYDAAKLVCDTATKACVACLKGADCTYSAALKVCDPATSACVACLQSADCTYSATKPVCATATKTCVACVQSKDCGATKPVCDSASNTCVGCLGSGDCTYDAKRPLCDTATRVCVNCLSDADCTAAGAPVCDSATARCRGCKIHGECSVQGKLCAADGSCPAASAISYVDASNTSGTADGTAAHPYTKITDALGKPPKYVLVKAGTYGDLVINKSHEIYGAPGAVIQPSACDKVIFSLQAKALLAGFEIKGNVKVTDGGTEATLLHNTIGPSVCTGVTAAGGDPTLRLRGNLIWHNTDGGLFVDGYYTIENNYIVQNGSAATSYGGAKLKPQTGAEVFSNNTVADNVSKGSSAAEAAIRCEGAVVIHNSIVWGNTFTSTVAKQLDIDCDPRSCDVEDGLTGPFPDAKNNISAAPNFKGSGAGAAPWHLSAPSPCDGAADSAQAPAVDYDGDTRSTSAPDIGADEI